MPAAAVGAVSAPAGQTAVRATAPALVRHTDRVVTGRTATSGRTASSRTTDLLAPSSIHLLAARLYWGDHPPAYPSTRRARTDLSRTAAYFERVSRGHESFDVTLTRWIHVPASRSTMCSREGASARIARAALSRAGYHPARYNRLMLLTEQCNAAVSVAQEPGTTTWIRYRNPGLATLVHELGHNLDLGHAYGVVCRQDGLRVPLGGTCRAVEYGDSWDAMGHSRASFSLPTLTRLGWAGSVATTTGGTFALADVEHPGSSLQGLRIPVGDGVTYWVEYQPDQSTQIGRSIPGVMIRRQVGDGPVEIVDASPGNPAGIAFPDRDLTNPALPAGSSITTPEGLRITTVSVGDQATVQVDLGQTASAPAAPTISYAALLASGSYRVHWQPPADNGQIVLGYRVTAEPSGVSTFVRSPGAYRTSSVVGVARHAPLQTFTVVAVNQAGWSPASPAVSGAAYGPVVTLNSPRAGAHVPGSFTVTFQAAADKETHAQPVRGWADVGGTTCAVVEGAGPYTVTCTGVPHGRTRLSVHVTNANGATTDVATHVLVH